MHFKRPFNRCSRFPECVCFSVITLSHVNWAHSTFGMVDGWARRVELKLSSCSVSSTQCRPGHMSEYALRFTKVFCQHSYSIRCWFINKFNSTIFIIFIVTMGQLSSRHTKYTKINRPYEIWSINVCASDFYSNRFFFSLALFSLSFRQNSKWKKKKKRLLLFLAHCLWKHSKLYILHAWNNMRSRAIYFWLINSVEEKTWWNGRKKGGCVFFFNEHKIVSFKPNHFSHIYIYIPVAYFLREDNHWQRQKNKS